MSILWRILTVLLLALLVSGCAPGTPISLHSGASPPGPGPSPTPSSGSTTIIDGPSGPPYVTLKDTSPGQLSLFMGLTIGGYDAQSRDITEMDVGFTHEGQIVQFAAGEHISCNGLAVPGYGSNFDLKAPSALFSGKLITCTYFSGKTSATFTFTCPLAPTILSPQENAQVRRSSHMQVSYRISPAWAYYVIALGPSEKAWTAEAPAQPNPITLDTSAFLGGPGSIAIHQFFSLSDLYGPAFRSVKEEGSSAAYEIDVTWI